MPERIKLPQHLECEDDVIGAALMDPACAEAALSSLAPGDFVRPCNRLVFQAMADVAKAGVPVDVKTVCDRMINARTVEDAGGADYVLGLVNAVITDDPAVFRHHLKLVKSDSIARRYLDSCDGAIKAWAEDPGQEPLSFISSTLPLINEAANRGADSGFRRTDEITPSLERDVEAARLSSKAGLLGIDTGLAALNRMTHGWKPEQLIVLGARTSMGKTSLALNFAMAAAGSGCAVGFFSFEMSAESLVRRMAARLARVDGERIESGMVSQDELARIKRAASEIDRLPIYFSDKNTGLLRDLVADANRLKLAHPELKAIVVDYIGLMSVGGRVESRQTEIAAISRKLKQLASTLKISVILLAQLNRDAESDDGARPTRTDIRDSGAIEQDADLIMLLHRPSFYLARKKGEEEAPINVCEIIIDKQRDGRTGIVHAVFERPYSNFCDSAIDEQKELNEREAGKTASTSKERSK